VPEHPEKKVAALLYLGVKVAHRLRDSLINCLIEPDYFFPTRFVERTGIDPEPENAGA
jgi:hypothetical protein